MTRQQLTFALLQLRDRHPGAHPFTLALLLQVETDVVISGQFAKELLTAADQVMGW